MKAVFMDYMGTMVQETGSEIMEVVTRACHNSNLKNPKDVMLFWWSRLKQYEENSYQETYRTEDEIVDRLLSDLEREMQLKENRSELHLLLQKFWVNAPLFPDVKDFFEKCPIPIYVISNNGVEYVAKAMRRKGLVPAGIVCADMVRAYKPHKELFDKALEISGRRAEEVLHVGDSYSSDVRGALAAGIKPILVARQPQEVQDDVQVVRGLLEILPQLY